MKVVTILVLVFLITACGSTTKEKLDESSKAKAEVNLSKPANEYVGTIEKAHQKADFLAKKAVAFDVLLSFGGKERLNARLTLDVYSSRGVLDYANGDKVYYIDDKVFYKPEMEVENPKRLRFGAYTWAYFFLYPYKLSDPGTIWEAYPKDSLNGKAYEVQKLSFKDGVGDSPDDWYINYANPKTHLIEVAAYIVTASKSKEEAEEDPHAIKYEEYIEVEGIPISTKWTFWAWRKKEGLTKQLGEAALKNIKFVETTDAFWTAPQDYKVIK